MIEIITTFITNPFQLLSYLGTLFCMVSYCMKNEFRLRAMCILSSVVFIPYTLFIGATSLLLLNSFLFVINSYKLIKMKQREKVC